MVARVVRNVPREARRSKPRRFLAGSADPKPRSGLEPAVSGATGAPLGLGAMWVDVMARAPAKSGKPIHKLNLSVAVIAANNSSRGLKHAPVRVTGGALEAGRT